MNTSRTLAALACALVPAFALAEPAPSGPARTWNFEGTLWESLDLQKSATGGSAIAPAQVDGAASAAPKRSSASSGSAAGDDAAQAGSGGALAAAGGMGKPVVVNRSTNDPKANDPNAAAPAATWSAPSSAPATVAPVPEPQTYVLMLAGLGALGMVLRRKRRSAGPS